MLIGERSNMENDCVEAGLEGNGCCTYLVDFPIADLMRKSEKESMQSSQPCQTHLPKFRCLLNPLNREILMQLSKVLSRPSNTMRPLHQSFYTTLRKCSF